SLQKELLSFPNLAYVVGGFVLLVGIILLFIFLRRRRRVDSRRLNNDVFQLSFGNEIYSLEYTDNNDRRERSAENMLYTTHEECRNEINDVTEC
ncbi:Hypothetical predicted protein, partial [Paramuricea clavata]